MNVSNLLKTQAPAGANSAATTPAAASKQDPLTSKDTFLQLLVAQMRNQDPLQPTDSVQYVSQLAQFSSLEQSLELNKEVAAVKTSVDALAEIVKQNGIPSKGAPSN